VVSRGLGDVYKRQESSQPFHAHSRLTTALMKLRCASWRHGSPRMMVLWPS
jgi:hypothetical protein